MYGGFTDAEWDPSGIGAVTVVSERAMARDVELALFRVVQEALTNIHRHSGSQRAKKGIWSSQLGISRWKLATLAAESLPVYIEGMRSRGSKLVSASLACRSELS